MTCREDKTTSEVLNSSTEEDSKYYTRQICGALVPILSTIVTGMTIGYSAVLLPQLKVPSNVLGRGETEIYPTNVTAFDNTGIVVGTIDEESWIAASSALAMVPGCWLASLLMAKLGRKTSFLVINPITLAGWLLLALAQNLAFLIAGRLLCGLCVGLLGATSPVYITEISHPQLRGLLLAALSLAVAVGIFFVHALGTWLSWRLTAYISAVIPAICFVIGLFVTESPVFLLSRDRTEEALAAWSLLRGEHSKDEFQALKAKHETLTKKDAPEDPGTASEFKFWSRLTDLSWRARFANRSFLLPLMIVCMCSFVSQFSGMNVVTFYCVQMLREVSAPEHAYMGTLVLDSVRITMGAVACWLIRRFPRRSLALISGLGTCLTLFGLSGCLFADFGRPWLPIVMLFVHTGTVAVGLVPLPWLLCAELFDGNNRGLGSGLGAGFAFLSFFAVVKTGPLAFNVLTPAGTFALYGAVVLLGSGFLCKYLPETKDKTLRGIENVFARKTSDPSRDDKSTAPECLP